MTDELDPIEAFAAQNAGTIATYAHDTEWRGASDRWLDLAFRRRYMYHFSWLGRPIIQLPADMIAMQEVIWQVKPDLVVEMGIADGGSLVLSASVLALLDLVDARTENPNEPIRPRRSVLGVDIDIRPHNRRAIEEHPLADWIEMFEGSSVDPAMVDRVGGVVAGHQRILVVLDSNHTHEHVTAELEAYTPMTSVGSYCVVFDTIVDDLAADVFPDRPWGEGNNPKTAVKAYLDRLSVTPQRGFDDRPLHFVVDRTVEDKLMLSVAPHGFLRRT